MIPPGRQDLLAAADRLRGLAHVTPVLTSTTLDERTGARVYLKCENLQRVGAFKFRGAYNAIASLEPEERQRGLVTHSSGNHGQAVALAARLFGAPARVVVPEGAQAVKRAAVATYGGDVIPCAPTQEARQETADRVTRETGSVFIHPYDDPRIVAGQSTVAQELWQQVPKLDYLLVPVGGGGLVGGSCLAARHFSPGTRVIACEPAGAADAAASFAAGSLQPMPPPGPDTVADGLRASLSELTFGILREHAAAVLTVEDSQTLRAMRVVWERLKMVIEPSAAVAVAVLLEGLLEKAGFEVAGTRVGVVISGGNVDLDRLPWQAAA
ncbi:MAG: pyridoxal-phosphate dependent enzyme [Acidobacteriota bacterium]